MELAIWCGFLIRYLSHPGSSTKIDDRFDLLLFRPYILDTIAIIPLHNMQLESDPRCALYNDHYLSQLDFLIQK